MYSRNQNRSYSDEDYEDEELSEEDELFAYNLPPNYDGSRFRRPKHPRNHRKINEDRDTNIQATLVPKSIEKPAVKSEEREHPKLFDSLGIKLSSEELLIITLILILAAENDHSDTLLWLAVLLAVK